MDRRTVLAAAGVGLATSLGGCLADVVDGGPPDRPWPSSDPVDQPDGTHHLFVENLTGTTETAWIRVVRADGAALVDGRYELPDRRGIEFESLAAWETTYTVELSIDGGTVTELEWYTPGCGPDSEAPGDSGSRNASVRLEATGGAERQVSLVRDECDALRSPAVPVGSAETFRLDE